MRERAMTWVVAGVFLIMFGLATSPAAAGNKIIVDGSDVTDDGGGCGSKANPCDTIQAGIDNASAGDTVEVRKGTYAGAVVDKAVHLKAKGKVTIDSGPISHQPPGLQAGFLFDPDRSGSGARIEGFDFVGTAFGIGDGLLDFAIFSRGADNVSVSHNSMTNVLQGITNWNGTGWTIEHNKIEDLWTLNGGGIGILVGGFDGSMIHSHVVSHNDVRGMLQVWSGDGGGYDGTGIVMFADFRFGRPGPSSISGNTIEHNKVELVSDAQSVVNANGIEVTVAGSSSKIIANNLFAHKNISGITFRS